MRPEPLATPPAVVAAHEKIDKAVDAMFDSRKQRWTHDNRLAHLLGRYLQLVNASEMLPTEAPSRC